MCACSSGAATSGLATVQQATVMKTRTVTIEKKNRGETRKARRCMDFGGSVTPKAYQWPWIDWG